MDGDDALTLVLRDFARNMLTDFSIQTILNNLVERIVEVLSVTGAGVTLISPGAAPHYVAASDGRALRFEQLQSSLAEGPCVSAYQSGEPVAVPDLAQDTRYPRFGVAAVAEGLAAVFTFPLRHGNGQLGALDLYRDTTGPLDPRELSAAQTLADVASAYLLHAQAREQVTEEAERLRHSSLHDPLTGLANRVLLQERLEHAAARAARTSNASAVLFIDLDRFKRVNDTYGHVAGDQVLMAVARRLLAALRPGDTLARVGGDEFVLLCENLTSSNDVDVVATRIAEALAAPFAIAGAELSITASVGVAFAGPESSITPDLLEDADTAMYQAKRHGGATHHTIDLYTAQEIRHRNDLEQDLRSALLGDDPEDRQLALAYQPIVRTADEEVVGVEALLRWTHPVRGTVPALTTISIAERTGMMVELGAWVLDRSCRDHAAWCAEHPSRRLSLSVNVSVRQLAQPHYVDAVAATVADTGMDPTLLILEVTESIFVDDADRAARVLDQLRALGVRVALDDFGTGYSSLGYLRRLSVDVVKIDRQFTTGIGTDPTDTAIVVAITQLARALDMQVTAEGVETHVQRDALLGIGCQNAQGYLYARPMTAAALTTHLAGDRLAG